MKKAIISILALGLSTAAYAADISTKAAPMSAPGTIQTINWTGPYVSLLLGYSQKSEDTFISGNDKTSAAIIKSGLFPSTVGLRPDGFTIGGRLGYDFQFGKIVAGGLVDWSYSSMQGNAYAGGNLIGVSYAERIDNIGHLMAKLGYLLGPTGQERAMVYVVGGGAWARVSNTVTANGILPAFGLTASGASDDTRWGYAIGSGLEYRLDRIWSMNVEYLYNDLGTQTTTVTMPVGKNSISWNNDQAVKFQQIMLGITARF